MYNVQYTVMQSPLTTSGSQMACSEQLSDFNVVPSPAQQGSAAVGLEIMKWKYLGVTAQSQTGMPRKLKQHGI